MDRTPTSRELRASAAPRTSATASLAALVVTIAFFSAFLAADKQWTVLGLVAAATIAVLVASRLGWIAAIKRSYRDNERTLDISSIAAVLVLSALFYTDPFVLLLIATVLIFAIACIGLNVQFGYAGMLNFAGAAMLGVGAYTAAVLGAFPSIPTFVILPAGAMVAALIGSVLLPPMLRTYGHYSAVITIAFGLLFMTFIEISTSFGGPQGLSVRTATLLGWSLNDNIKIGNLTISFYINYVVLALVLLVIVAGLVRRLERSWIGLNLDAIRLDETASRCFGLNIALWKTVAFTAGNFIAGLAGTFYALMLGYISPSNFSFGDSLILVTIILLGGLGSIWGVILTAAIVIILPEKLQAIQEYRFFLYAILVAAAILFQPNGLIPRAQRRYVPGLKI